MVLDVSHLSDPGLEHVLEVARRPFIASHSSCRDLRAHPRNLTDAQLRAVAASGGFIGLNGFGPFLAEDAVVDDYVTHISHAVEVVGADHVGLGLDFVDDLFATMDPVLGGALVDPRDCPPWSGCSVQQTWPPWGHDWWSGLGQTQRDRSPLAPCWVVSEPCCRDIRRCRSQRHR